MSAPKAEAAGLTVGRREELRRVAEAATPGPWWNYGSWPYEVHDEPTDDDSRQLFVAGREGSEEDSHFVAAFDPPTVLALLDALTAAEVEVAHWKGHAEEAGRGFTQVCKDYARSAARVSRVGTWLERHEHMGRPCACYDEVRAALDTASSEGA